MCVKQNAIDHDADYLLAFKVVNESYYVDDGLTEADTVQGAVKLQKEMQSLFQGRTQNDKRGFPKVELTD